MIECNIYKNTNADSKYYGKWYPRNEPKGIVDLDDGFRLMLGIPSERCVEMK